MLPGNVDPRRPDKVQRYKAPTSNNGQGEDLTPDYMNILGRYYKYINILGVYFVNSLHWVLTLRRLSTHLILLLEILLPMSVYSKLVIAHKLGFIGQFDIDFSNESLFS